MPIRAPAIPPTVPPTRAPANADMIGPAAREGPKPGIAGAPIPANHPSAPPRITRLPAPAESPSGAFVFFSGAKSLVPELSGNNTEMSVFGNPPAFNSSTPISTLVIDGYMPNTAVFLPAIQKLPSLNLDEKELIPNHYHSGVDLCEAICSSESPGLDRGREAGTDVARSSLYSGI